MMERNNNNGGCCFEQRPRYGGGGQAQTHTGQQQQAWQMGRIMLKFRPIAPKPAAMAAAAPVPVTTAVGPAGKGRKRKAVAGRRGRKPKKAATTVAVAAPATTQVAEKEKDKSSSYRSSSSSGMTSVDSSPPPPPAPPATTLPLMQLEVAAAAPVLPDLGAGQPAVAPRASSWVTVEDVTATWRDCGEGPPAAGVLVDGEAPAFVSDRWGRVTWANAAFSREVTAGAGDDDDDDDEAVMVVVGAKDAKAVPAWGTCAGFSCRVRVVRRRCGGGSSLVAPCDVWRLVAAGGYLWRLDLQATLTLSLGGLL